MTRPLAILAALVAAATLPAAAATAPHHGAPQKTVTLPDGLKYTDVVIGHGALPKPGQTVTVQYVGTFPDGRKFDSSRDRNEPFSFTLGVHEVIPCWDEAVASMRVGGRRKLICPPSLAYGPNAQGPIPANATLDFDVELLAVK
jgi:peptidylprolyl isomerase